MKAKRFWLVLLAILSVLCMSLAIAGCGEEAEVTPNLDDFTRPKHEHTFSEWEIVTPVQQCSEEDGLRRRRCTDPECTTEGGFVEEEVIPAIGHDKEIVNRKEPTCIDGGWNEYWKCKKCGASDYEDQKIGPLGHDWRTIEAQEATCYQEGWEEHEECYRCHKTQGNFTIHPITAHDYSIERDGFHYCSMCGQPQLDETPNLTYRVAEDGKSYIVTGYQKKDGKILDETGKVYEYQDATLEADENCNLYVVNGDQREQIDYHRMMSLVIPDKHKEGNLELPVSAIDGEAFKECKFITRVVTGTNVTTIGREAFTQCNNLTEITLGPNTTTIDSSAFSYSNVESINFPRKVNSIGMMPFAYCPRFTKITVDSKNNTYICEGNCVISRASDTIVLGCGGSVIPESAKYIGTWAFGMCPSLKKIDTKNVEQIYPQAFMLDSNLEEVVISDKCEFIDANAFYGCASLFNLELGAGLTRIGNAAFANCKKLKVVKYNGTQTQFLDGTHFMRGEHWDFDDGLVDEDGNYNEDGQAKWTRRTYLVQLKNAQYLMASADGYESCTKEQAEAFLAQIESKDPEQSEDTGSENEGGGEQGSEDTGSEA